MKSIGKKLGQIGQWTGEKMGNTQKTETSPEFQRLQADTDARKECLERIQAPMESYYKQLSKTIDCSGSSQKLLLEALADAMEHYGSVLPNDSIYGVALTKAAKCHDRIAQAQSKLAENLIEGYLLTIHDCLDNHKEYVKVSAKLENRRLDFDAKLNKVQKSKKENTILEEETRVCQAKYEESLETITEKMIQLNSEDVSL